MLSQAISDAYLKDEKQKKNVLEWITSKDFKTVCDCAYVDFDKMTKIFYKIIHADEEEARKNGKIIKSILDN